MNAPVERIPGPAGLANAMQVPGGAILVGHASPLVAMGLLATLRRQTLHDVATLEELAGRSPGRGVDVVVADAAFAGRLVKFATGLRRSRTQAGPKVLLIDAGKGAGRRDAPVLFDACLDLECRQQDLVDAVNALVGFGKAAVSTAALPEVAPACGSRDVARRVEGIALQAPRNDGFQPRGGLPSGALRRVCETMEQRLEDKLELTDLAAVAGLSKSHFARAFKQSVGQTPHRYLMARRVSAATRLIKDTERSLTEIAVSMGFFDQSHFARVFTHAVGETPGAYRRRHR